MFFLTAKLFAQCNIETFVTRDSTFTINHVGEFIEDDAEYDSKGNRLTEGMRLTHLTTTLKVRDVAFYLNVCSGSTYPYEPIIAPKVIKFVFENDENLIIKCVQYNSCSEDPKFSNFINARFILSLDETRLLMHNDIKKMIIVDDTKQREVKLKLPNVFSRQINCLFEEVERLGKGDISNVKK
jgi:hypothetical protein